MKTRKQVIDDARRYARLHLSSYCNDDDRLMDLMMMSIGRVLVNRSLSSGVDILSDVQPFTIHHIRDWLKAATLNEAPWLSKVDERNRPKKLLKFGSLSSIMAEADRDMLKIASRSGKIADDEGDVEIHTVLSDGYSMVKLLTPRALDRESRRMKHCVGNGAYDDHLSGAGSMLLSLRDRFGNPHATLEVVDHEVQQIRGKHNQIPVGKYQMVLAEFFRKHPTMAVNGGDGWEGFVLDVEGNVHSLTALPAVLRRNGDLYLEPSEECVDQMPTPQRIEASGMLVVNIDLYDGPIMSIDCGKLIMKGGLRSLGPETRINQGSASGKPLESLSLFHMPDLKNIPAHLRCTGSIVLNDIGMSEFPSSLFDDETETPGSVQICLSEIGSLGRFRTVNGDFRVADCPSFEVPEGFRVRGDMVVSSSKININGILFIDKRLEIQKSAVELLGAVIDADTISITNSIVNLGPELSCGSISLARSSIGRMPDWFDCDGELVLSNARFDRLPRQLRAQRLVLSGDEIDRIDGEVRIKTLSLLDGRTLEFGPEVIIDRVELRCTVTGRLFDLPFGKAVEYLKNPRKYGAFIEVSMEPFFEAKAVSFHSSSRMAA